MKILIFLLLCPVIIGLFFVQESKECALIENQDFLCSICSKILYRHKSVRLRLACHRIHQCCLNSRMLASINWIYISLSFHLIRVYLGRAFLIKSMHKDKSTNFLEHRQFQRFQGLLHCKFQLQLRVHFFHYRNHQK